MENENSVMRCCEYIYSEYKGQFEGELNEVAYDIDIINEINRAKYL